VTEITRLAEKESRFIDDHHPEYAYSSKAAIGRGSLVVFQTAAQKAMAIFTTKNGNARGHLCLISNPVFLITPEGYASYSVRTRFVEGESVPVMLS
jgi:hypothetical protein